MSGVAKDLADAVEGRSHSRPVANGRLVKMKVGGEKRAATRARSVPDAPWRDRLTLNSDGDIKSSLPNATLLLQYDPEWSGVLGWDERAEEPMFVSAPPFPDAPNARVPRPLVDADAVRAAQWLEERHGVTLSLPQLHAVMDAVAATAPFDRVREYLDERTWDGVLRLDSWLSDYLGVAVSDYASAVGRKWPISAVARTYQPGCKADHVLVLEGAQGLGKSTALRVFAGDAHFGDDIPALGSKDAQQYLGTRWIVELSEMDAASKAEAATLKRFLTTTEDRYRPPYGRRTVVHARRCVFAGSVNLEEYLRDSTGGRRFWPVTCHRVDIAGLTAARDQLWAEAVAAYRAGESWYLDDPKLAMEAASQQAQRLEADPWEDAIAPYLAVGPRVFVTTAELLTDALRIETPRLSKADRNRVGAVMRHLGWVYGEGTDRQRGWLRP